MVRVLKRGGRLVITDLDQHEHTWMRVEMADTWLGFDRGEVRGWLRAAGLVNAIVDSTCETCSSNAQSDPAAAAADISIFVTTGSRRGERRDGSRTGRLRCARDQRRVLWFRWGAEQLLLAVLECDGLGRGRKPGCHPMGYGAQLCCFVSDDPLRFVAPDFTTVPLSQKTDKSGGETYASCGSAWPGRSMTW